MSAALSEYQTFLTTSTPSSLTTSDPGIATIVSSMSGQLGDFRSSYPSLPATFMIGIPTNPLGQSLISSPSSLWDFYNNLSYAINNDALLDSSFAVQNMISLLSNLQQLFSTNPSTLIVGNIADTSSNPKKLKIEVQGGETLIFNGADYSALEEIALLSPQNNNTTFITKASAPNTPLILNNAFVFPQGGSNITLDVETDITLTDPSIGSAYTPPPQSGMKGTYTGGFGNITGNGGAKLTVDIANAEPIILSNEWTNTGGGDYSMAQPGTWSTGNSYLGNLTLMTPTTITSPSATNIGNISIGSTQVTIRPESINQTPYANGMTYNIAPTNSSAILKLDSSHAGGDVIIELANGFTTTNINSSSSGTMVLSAQDHKLTASSATSAQQPLSFGSSNAPLFLLEMEGNSAAAITPTGVYTDNLKFNTSGTVQLPDVTLSDGGSIILEQDVVPGSQLFLNAPSASSLGATVNLGAHTFNAGVATVSSSTTTTNTQPPSTITFAVPLTINTTLAYNSTGSAYEYGHFVVDGGGSSTVSTLQNPSTLNLTDAQQLTINFTPDLDHVPTDIVSLPLFMTTDQFNTGTLGQVISVPTSSAQVIYTNPNLQIISSGVVTWNYDNGALVPTVDLYKATNNLPASPPAVTLIENFVKNYLQDGTTSPTNVSPAVLQLVNAVLSAPDAITAAQAAERLVPQASAQAATLEAVGLATDRVTTQAVGTAVIDNLIDVLPIAKAEELEGLGASAGDNPTHGAWASGFFQKAIQKSYGTTAGYKVQTTGGTFGGDTKINDNVTIGGAWTTTHDIVKNRDALAGNKSTTNSNIFSLYGLTTLSNNWIVNGSLSGGVARTTSRIEQRFGATSIYGGAKNKSKTYAANIQAIKLIAAGENLVLQPTIGLSYNQFNDDGYTQTGTVVAQHVAARKSYNWEGLLGGKVLGIYNYNDFIIKPNASAYAHITIKDKKGKIHTSLDATTGQIPVDQSKASRAWYSAGTGLTATKGAWEVGVSYELQLDKKYVGHQGTLRLRVEF